MNKTLLSFGHGYSSQEIVRPLLAEGWQVTGTTRSATKADKIASTGATPLIWPGSEVRFDGATHLLLSAGPNDAGDPVLNALEQEITARAGQFEWVGYLSTTGVYGDQQGGWVDEGTPPGPSTRRGQLRMEAEAAWAAIPNLPLHIFRLAGIWGPGRGPFAKLREGKTQRVIKENQVFSRIHVHDIGQVVRASIARPNPGAIYNVCDNKPAPPQDVIAYAAELMGVPAPPEVPYEEAEMPPMARSFYADSKRVRNNRIKDELGVVLKYPDYRTTLRAMLEEERTT